MTGLEKGDLKPVVAEAFPFDRAPDAHRMIEERRNIGKVVLVPDRSPHPLSRPPRRYAAPVLVLASIGSLYERAIVDTDRQPEFLFFVAFLLTFGFIRTSAHLIRAQVSWWPGNVEVGGTHIHHLVWGILLLLAAGYVGVAIAPPSPWHEIVTILFGVGTGLTLDEFALWLNLKDVYWSEQGRRSIDAVIVAATVTGMVLVGFTAWVDVATEVEAAVFAVVGAFGVITILAAVVNLAKEKFGMAIVGLLIPPGGPGGRVAPRKAELAVGAALPRAKAGAGAGAVRRAGPRPEPGQSVRRLGLEPRALKSLPR